MSMITPDTDLPLTFRLRLSQELQVHSAQGRSFSGNVSLRGCGSINSIGYLARKMPSSVAHDGQIAVGIWRSREELMRDVVTKTFG